jgi:exodeoxyribonuclease V alpha subunit
MPVERVFDIEAIYQELRAGSGSQESTPDLDNKNLDNKNKEFKKNIELNEDQQRGILTCLQNKVTIITGGPGTGKTTLIKTLLGILDAQKQTYKLAAPTGRAAKRMQEGTGRYAETLHRLLEFDVSTMGFTKNEQNALKTDFLIVDEASMIDIFLAHALLKAIPFSTHLILIGDIHQLPSVGAGNFLSDVIASKVTPCIKLSIIFRQAQNSLIIINAHRINSGEFPTSQAENANRDFIFIKEQEPTNVQAHIENIIKKGLPKFGIKPADMAVLVPMNRGTVGTQKINFDVQQLLNGGKQDQVMHAGITFKVGDRVMQIRNNYDKHVFNGDTGAIESIDTRDQLLHVQYPDKTVEYEFSELDELVLAYAISIHKSQGSEYPAVVIPLFMQHFMLLQRNLLYTAVTRAKKLCILIGQPKAVAMCINNNKGLARTTFLTAYLTSDLQCR